ncbi:MAG: hypothetical protein K0R68_3204 [Mycobacterium sp.]|nr:hypothetical protein [Mycobacterium sp.]
MLSSTSGGRANRLTLWQTDGREPYRNGNTVSFPLEQETVQTLHMPAATRWHDAESDCTIVAAAPHAERELWNQYLDGARRSYHKYGVDAALDWDEISDGSDTALFFAAIDSSGKVAGGVRAKEPYRTADQSHAVVEWEGQPGHAMVRKMINDRIPFGLSEMKTAWTSDDPGRSKALTTTLARTAMHTMSLLDIQFIMATAAAHVLDRWRSSGGVVVSRIPATPYPDVRYRTKIMFWDRRTYANHAQPNQVARILSEAAYLAPVTHELSSVPAASAGARL